MGHSLKSYCGVLKLLQVRYNTLEVIDVAVAREHIKALIDRLTDEQAQALWVVLNSMAWPEEKLSPDEIAEIEEARAEIRAGKGIKAEDVWRELGL